MILVRKPRLALVVDEMEKRRATLTADQQRVEQLADPNFPEQHRFVMDPNQFISALCTRRAGKSNGLALRFFRTMHQFPGSFCRYIALTRDSAKDIMWPILQEVDEKHKLGAKFFDTKLVVELKNGSSMRLYGADMRNFIKRLKGVKSPGVAIDEAQDFGPHIESLVDDVLTPTISDYRGSWLAVTGTPGPIPFGYFYDITHQGKGGYSVHKWSLYNNPYFPDPHAFVKRLKEKKKWADDNPTYLREWMGQWVLDRSALVLFFDPAKNDYADRPKGNYTYILGVDLGFKDADAIGVLGWNEQSPITYLVEEDVQRKQDLTTLFKRIEILRKKYDACKIIVDTGGLGLKIAEELRKRYKKVVVAADKREKFANLELLNDALRTGMFKARKDSQFAKECNYLKWDLEHSRPDRKVISESFHSDIIEAVLYAWKESPSYAYEKSEERPAVGTKQWQDEEAARMEQELEDRLRQQQSDKEWGEW